MPINATNSGTTRELIPAGNYIARCYQMIEIGTVTEFILGKQVVLPKVRIGWELPSELKIFKEENGEQPLVISQEYTLSMNEKANLRKMLASWRGQDFAEAEAKCFDITKLLGKACMLNIIHKPSKSDPTKIYQQIAGVTSIPKGFTVPAQLTKSFVLSYDNFDYGLYDTLPDFIKTKMQGSLEFVGMKQPNGAHMQQQPEGIDIADDLPF